MNPDVLRSKSNRRNCGRYAGTADASISTPETGDVLYEALEGLRAIPRRFARHRDRRRARLFQSSL